MSHKEAHDLAVELRRKGYSYSYISEKTKKSKGTLNYWLSDVPYVPNHETVEKIGRARVASTLTKSRIRKASLEDAKSYAETAVGTMYRRDVFMLGLGLYLGEGTKTHNIVRMINSNPDIIRFSIKWFREVFGITRDHFRIRLHLYPDSDVDASIQFWSSQVGLSKKHFYPVHVDRRKDKKASKRGKTPYGTAHLSVISHGKRTLGVTLFRRINAMIETVLMKEKK
ncbi:MAG: hypothetical protein WCO79_00330 [bacterium]